MILNYPEFNQSSLEHTKRSFVYKRNIHIFHLAYTKYRCSFTPLYSEVVSLTLPLQPRYLLLSNLWSFALFISDTQTDSLSWRDV